MWKTAIKKWKNIVILDTCREAELLHIKQLQIRKDLQYLTVKRRVLSKKIPSFRDSFQTISQAYINRRQGSIITTGQLGNYIRHVLARFTSLARTHMQVCLKRMNKLSFREKPNHSSLGTVLWLVVQ